LTPGPVAFYVATSLCYTGTFATIPLIISWITNNIGGQTKRILTLSVVVGFGNTSGIMSPYTYSKNYFNGLVICLSFMCCALISTLILKLKLRNENTRRANLTQEQRLQELEREELYDWHPDFTYTT
ncbi:unnamed protein product, partial [Didymodactylos carnosus]